MKASEIVAKFKEVLLSTEEEVETQEVAMEEEVEMMPEEMPKAESVSMEDFNKLKAEVAELKGMIEKSLNSEEVKEEVEVPAELEEEVKEELKEEVKEEVKEELSAEPIVHTPEEIVVEKKMNLFSQDRQETRLERIFSKINNK